MRVRLTKLVALGILLGGCASPSIQSVKRDIPPALSPYPTMADTVRPGGPDVTDEMDWGSRSPALSLLEAATHALHSNPNLRAAAKNLGIADGQIQQARLRPNPELGFESEDISGSFAGLSETENALVLSQTFELGGKRESRVRHATSGLRLAEHDFEIQRLDVLAGVTSRFINALAAQQKLTLATEAIRITEQLVESTAKRVVAGAIPEVEVIRANIALSNARVDSSKVAVEWTNAKSSLAAMWGQNGNDFETVVGELGETIIAPELAALLLLVEHLPDITRWTAAVEHERAGLGATRAMAKPDLTVSAGTKLIGENNRTGFVLGVSLPLPFRNRNQGDIVSGLHSVAQAEWAREAALLKARTELSVAYESMAMALSEVGTIQETILPAAEQAFDAIKRGYQHGLFSYLDVLTAEDDLIQARARLIDALSESHLNRVQVERRIGSAFTDVGTTNSR